VAKLNGISYFGLSRFCRHLFFFFFFFLPIKTNENKGEQKKQIIKQFFFVCSFFRLYCFFFYLFIKIGIEVQDPTITWWGELLGDMNALGLNIFQLFFFSLSHFSPFSMWFISYILTFQKTRKYRRCFIGI
jgi:hypothetical protein